MNTILSIAFGNYLVSSDGTCKFVLEQQRCANKNGYTYLYIYPLNLPRKILSLNIAKTFWGVMINGKHVGIFSTNDILNWIEQFNIVCVFINHFKRVHDSELFKILDKISEVPIKVFLHDYFTVCQHINLLDDNFEFCGTEQLSERKCNTRCSDGKEMVKRFRRFQCFYCKYIKRIELIAPSESVKNNYISFFPELSKKIRTVYHQKLVGRYTVFPCLDRSKLKIAYVGYKARNKGWLSWQKAALSINLRDAELYHFGKSNDAYEFIKKVSVDFRKDEMAMIKALREFEINVAVLWSIWPETYSYTYYECLAANTFVITNQISGNICDQIKLRGNGIVLSNEDELIDLFADLDKLYLLVRSFYNRCNYGPYTLATNDEVIKECRKATITKSETESKILLKTSFSAKIVEFMYRVKEVVKKLYD